MKMEQTAIKPRDVMPQTARTLPARYYTDPALFDAELEGLFGRMWFYAGRSEEIARAGQYVVREMNGRNVVVTRNASGEARAFHNVCRHRGTRICPDATGQFAGSIQCPYHAWTYDLDGRLIGAPHMDEVPHFDKSDYPLLAVHAGEWDGHVFLNLGERPAALFEQLGPLVEKFRPWQMQDLRLGKRIVYDVKANWKLIVQNYNECLHCPNLHPALNKLSHYLSGENEPLRPTYMGGVMDLRPGIATLSMDGTCPRSFFPGLSDPDRRRVYYYCIFPNLMLSLHPDYMLTHALWPIAPDRTINVCEWHFHPSELARPDFNPSDCVEFWDMTNKQDWYVCELSQAGISSPAYVPGPYSNREDLLYAFDRFIVDFHSNSKH
jgi:phenylpropionate dioxygenase-like ring-hydroxylating dioxygenase large terminal subunit